MCKSCWMFFVNTPAVKSSSKSLQFNSLNGIHHRGYFHCNVSEGGSNSTMNHQFTMLWTSSPQLARSIPAGECHSHDLSLCAVYTVLTSDLKVLSRNFHIRQTNYFVGIRSCVAKKKNLLRDHCEKLAKKQAKKRKRKVSFCCALRATMSWECPFFTDMWMNEIGFESRYFEKEKLVWLVSSITENFLIIDTGSVLTAERRQTAGSRKSVLCNLAATKLMLGGMSVLLHKGWAIINTHCINTFFRPVAEFVIFFTHCDAKLTFTQHCFGFSTGCSRS